MPRLPKKLSANTPQANWCNEVVDYLRSLTPMQSNSSRVQHTPFGTIHTADNKTWGKTGSFAIRGEYSPTTNYVLNDVTVISYGLNQGTFVCIAATSYGVAPYTGGGNWMQLPGGLLGQWF